MSETMTTTNVTAPKTERAAKLQKAAAKVAKHTAGSNGQARAKKFHGVECPSGKFWNEKRIAIVKALKKLNATSAVNSKTAEQIAAKTGGVESHFVTRYCDTNEPLVAGGLVKATKIEGNRSMSYYLTSAGAKISGFDY